MSCAKWLLATSLIVLAMGAATSMAQDDADDPAGADAADAGDGIGSAGSVSADAAAAKQQFDAAQQDWVGVVQRIREIQQQRGAAEGADRQRFDLLVLDARRDADEVLNRLVEAGLAAYRADPAAFPVVNATLLSIAQFHLTGNAEGDGGDQYEKALPLITALLDAGAGETWPHLWAWGAIAAFCTNDFDLAEQYFAKGNEAGALGVNPPTRNPADPRLRLWETAKGYEGDLPALRRAWQREQRIRAAEAEANDLPQVRLTTTRGDIVLELFENQAPESVANMITLVKQGFYDGVVFHRVLPGFMAQGGDPTGTGSGGPGYNIRDEHNKPNPRLHFRGSISMANKGVNAPNSGSSQFFLTFIPTSGLDGKHAVFGRVIEGMEVAASIKRRNPQAPPPHPEPDRIIKAEVIRDRGHAYEFEKLPES